ncbi:MAG: PD-(D/E)XK nuclease family protein, partial [Magnetococcales bacterium]|nr:PD-(D/E)XK nuclease family protein [Magnetococcales bacterium]
ILSALEPLVPPDRIPQLPGAWARLFSRWAAAWGWPGERSLDSRAHQVVEAWGQLLEGFTRLDPLLGPLGLGEALGRLGELARRTPHQPRSPEAPVQILGVLETAGEDYDGLWLAGCGAGHWPPAPRPNPFLPLALQRRLELPRSGAEVELAFARRVTARLLAAAPRVVVSHARQVEDRPERVSPLLAFLPRVEPVEVLAAAPDPGWATRIRAARPVLDRLEDARGPAWQSREGAGGGAGLLRDQSQCPFRAFVRHRLHAHPLEEPATGPDAPVRGGLLHQTLELFWRQVEDSVTWQSWPPRRQAQVIEAVAAAGVAAAAREQPDWFPAPFQTLERQRLTRLLRAWLDLEQTREAPFRVLQPEGQQTLLLGGLELTLRPDRVDLLTPEEAGVLVLDYKTGAGQSPTDWFGRRPAEPQLPLYALAQSRPLAGLAFAVLRAGHLGFMGIVGQAGLLPDVHTLASHPRTREPGTDWAPLLDQWRETLTRLVGEFRAGAAAVDPLPRACRYCGLEALCRIRNGNDEPDPWLEDADE